VRAEDGKIAADLFAFMDDFRPIGPNKKEAWLAGRRAASILNHLGIQDAPRKRRDTSKAPGAWAGAVVRTDGDGVHVLVSQEKWDRAKAQLAEVWEMIEKDSNNMCRQRLEEIRGFFVYVTRTYIGLAPYLIGIHMTIDAWRAAAIRKDGVTKGSRSRPGRTEPYLSNIKETTFQILYTLWNSRTRNSNCRPLIQRCSCWI
jgi:hypothetical protein